MPALFVTVGDTILGQIIGRHFARNPVTSQNTNAISAEFTGQVREHCPVEVQLNAKKPARNFSTIVPVTSIASSLLICLPPKNYNARAESEIRHAGKWVLALISDSPARAISCTNSWRWKDAATDLVPSYTVTGFQS